MTSLDPFQKEISRGNNFLTRTETLPKEEERWFRTFWSFWWVGGLFISDKQTVKVEKTFQMHLVCMVTDLTYYCNLMSGFKNICVEQNKPCNSITRQPPAK